MEIAKVNYVSGRALRIPRRDKLNPLNSYTETVDLSHAMEPIGKLSFEEKYPIVYFFRSFADCMPNCTLDNLGLVSGFTFFNHTVALACFCIDESLQSMLFLFLMTLPSSILLLLLVFPTKLLSEFPTGIFGRENRIKSRRMHWEYVSKDAGKLKKSIDKKVYRLSARKRSVADA